MLSIPRAKERERERERDRQRERERGRERQRDKETEKSESMFMQVFTDLFKFDCETSKFCLCKSRSIPFPEPNSRLTYYKSNSTHWTTPSHLSVFEKTIS